MNTNEQAMNFLDDISDLHVTLLNARAIAHAFFNLYVEDGDPSQVIKIDPDTYNSLYCVLLEKLHDALELAERIDQ